MITDLVLKDGTWTRTGLQKFGGTSSIRWCGLLKDQGEIVGDFDATCSVKHGFLSSYSDEVAARVRIKDFALKGVVYHGVNEFTFEGGAVGCCKRNSTGRITDVTIETPKALHLVFQRRNCLGFIVVPRMKVMNRGKEFAEISYFSADQRFEMKWGMGIEVGSLEYTVCLLISMLDIVVIGAPGDFNCS